MKSEWIRHKGREILYANYSGLEMNFSELKTEVDHINMLGMQSEKPFVLLVNVHGTTGTEEIIDCLKHSAKLLQPKTKKTAVIGIKGVQMILLQAVTFFSKMEITPFKDIESAKDWLIKE